MVQNSRISLCAVRELNMTILGNDETPVRDCDAER